MREEGEVKLVKLIIFAFLVLIFQPDYGQEKRICLTFDDLPCVFYNSVDSSLIDDAVNKICSKLSLYEVPATGFVNEIKLYSGNDLIESRILLLGNWIAYGLDLGNHTYSHKDFNNCNLKEYSDDIIHGSKFTKLLPTIKNKRLKYFRPPYLHVGNSEAKADSLLAFLKSNGYVIAPVTIDNDDYLFAAAYSKALSQNDSILMSQVGDDYLRYTVLKLNYYELQTKRLFGRDINQIMLLHTSLLNSSYLDSLIVLLQKSGYRFISLDKALSDKAYDYRITRFGNWGISWIDRWALSMGKKGDFFKDEPSVPDYIDKLSQTKK